MIAKTSFLLFQVLHPNHAHMLDIKYSFLNILGHSEGYDKLLRKNLIFLQFQVHHVPDDGCPTADKREPGQELP